MKTVELDQKQLAYYALCTSELAWNMEDEDDETAILESAQAAIYYLKQVGIPYTNRDWSDIAEDAAALYCRLSGDRRN